MTNPTKIEKARAAREAAMPEIKRLVKKYGRPAVTRCLAQLREKDKTIREVAELKRKLASLEKKI